MKNTLSLSFAAALAVGLASLGGSATVHGAPQDPKGPKRPAPPVRIDMQMVKVFFGSDPTAPAVDNPPTAEKIALGKALFTDQSLSKSGNLSCASCHDLGNYGQDGKPKSPVADGATAARNTPTVWNAFRNYAQFWDARAATVEELVLSHVLDPLANGVADEADLVAKVKAKPQHVEAFAKVFAGEAEPVTAKNVSLALGAFQRSLVTKSKFEAFVGGDARALTNEEKLGLKTFMEVGCTQCHMSRLAGGNMIQKLGVYKPYPSTDTGRMQATKSESDKFLFKVPALLNVEKTAPYYHDGKIATLEEAVNNMAEIQLNRTLKPEETTAIVTFLKTLTGPLPAEHQKQ